MKQHIKGKDTTKSIALFCVIDLLFFPYIRLIHSTTSMLVLVLWYLINIQFFTRCRKELLFTLFIVFSLIWGALAYSYYSGFTTAIIVLFSIYLRAFLSEYGFTVKIERILKIFMVFVSFFAILYYISPQTYFNIRTLWTMSGNHIVFSDRLYDRFTLFYSDPNNASAIFVAIYAYLMTYVNNRSYEIVLYTALTGLCVASTLSVSGALELCLVMSLLCITGYGNKKTIVLAIVIVLIVLLFLLVVVSFGSVIDNEIINALLRRFSMNTTNATFGGRTDRWVNAIKNCFSAYNLLIGKAGVYDKDLKMFQPHSGYLFLLISYGMPSIFLYHKIFIKPFNISKPKLLVPFVPFLIVLLMNTGLEDFRYITSMAIITSFMQIRYYQLS